jgi:hypothetical protein
MLAGVIARIFTRRFYAVVVVSIHCRLPVVGAVPEGSSKVPYEDKSHLGRM